MIPNFGMHKKPNIPIYLRLSDGMAYSIKPPAQLPHVDNEGQLYNLRDRAKHVFSEARRVTRFMELCNQTSASECQSTGKETAQEAGRSACGANAEQSSILTELGALMNESQTSCAQLYQCSCPELDWLTHQCR
ncbi:unnamed protein product [Protopolystoma xenopodis]|uniref:Uncharacterized protein n=1 Tax=Protopolystoma xenopodis TaxID=117903 RepID=A0A448WS34_9PLAT|nr:unnamed protein product [Protopolystoma xenopodis]